MIRFRNCFLVLIPTILTSCGHYPVNARLEAYDAKQGYRFGTLDSAANSNELFIVLTLSGGGTRAAALAYGVMEGLHDTHVRMGENERGLLGEVDVISSVSGGSFPAAYYALYGDALFDSFERLFLKQDIQGDLLRRVLWNPLRLWSPTFSRIDLAAEYYDEHIYGHSTYGDLVERAQKPFLIINATDMTLGATFEFTQDQFDLLYSDLGSVSIGRAVAASSAFPIAFTPLTLRNYEKTEDFTPPTWIDLAMQDRDIASRRYQRARFAKSYLDAEERPYVHLLDGGIADNLGTRVALHALTTTDSPWSLLRMINRGQIEKVVFIIVNAKPQPTVAWDQRESAPGLGDVFAGMLEGLQANYTFDSAVLVKDEFDRNEQAQRARKDCAALLAEHCPETALPGDLNEADYYFITVSFEDIDDPDRRTYFQNLPTALTLEEGDVDSVIDIGSELLVKSVEFQRLLDDLR